MSRATEAQVERVQDHIENLKLLSDPVGWLVAASLDAVLAERAELLKDRERSKTYIVKVSRPQTDYTTYVGPSGGDAWTAHTINADLHKLLPDGIQDDPGRKGS